MAYLQVSIDKTIAKGLIDKTRSILEKNQNQKKGTKKTIMIKRS